MRKRATPALERGDALLKDIRRRIHDARVEVAEFLQRKKIRGMFRIPENITRRLVNRYAARTGGGVWRLASVEGFGSESW